jgi:hypothetical protein
MDKVKIEQYRLEMWPGYHAVTRLLHDGIYLNVDTAAKFIDKTTILEQITNRRQRNERPDAIAAKYDSSNPDMPRKTVMTSHNSKTYQVDGLVFDIKP